ncbi:MAG TPA: hypothetical protein VGD11_17825, partial [Mycobacteriales bacterium]
MAGRAAGRCDAGGRDRAGSAVCPPAPLSVMRLAVMPLSVAPLSVGLLSVMRLAVMPLSVAPPSVGPLSGMPVAVSGVVGVSSAAPAVGATSGVAGSASPGTGPASPRAGAVTSDGTGSDGTRSAVEGSGAGAGLPIGTANSPTPARCTVPPRRGPGRVTASIARDTGGTARWIAGDARSGTCTDAVGGT